MYLLGTVSALPVTLILSDMLYPSPSVLCVSHHRKPILCLNMRVPRTPSQVCPLCPLQWQEHMGMAQGIGEEAINLHALPGTEQSTLNFPFP